LPIFLKGTKIAFCGWGLGLMMSSKKTKLIPIMTSPTKKLKSKCFHHFVWLPVCLIVKSENDAHAQSFLSCVLWDKLP